MLDIVVVWSGEDGTGERVLRSLRTFLKSFEDSITISAYLEEQRSGTGAPAEGDYSSHRRSRYC
jgi:hypothetical protein